MQTSAPTTPTKRAPVHRQKEILTTPRSAKTAAIAKTLFNGPDYVQPTNFDKETNFSTSENLLGRTIQVGNSYFTYGKNMAEYKDSTTLYREGNRTALLHRLDTEGYLLIRGAIQYDTALTGRNKMIEHLNKKKAIDLKKGPLSDAHIADVTEDGWTVDAETGGFVNNRESDDAIDGWREIGWCPEVRNVYNGPDLHALYRFLWGKPRTRTEDGYVALSQNTWLRAKGKGEVTSEHADYYYFKQNTTTFQENRHPYIENAASMWNEENPIPDGTPVRDIVECDLCLRQFVGSQQIPKATNWDKDVKGEWHCHDCASQFTPFYTCWISLGEYLDDNSTLCMMPKTQNLTQFDRPLRTDLLPEDYNELVKAKWGWLRTNFGLGDIVLFNWKTVHGASKNTMTKFRFSIDTRVCSAWFRPKGLFGDKHLLKYDYPQDEPKPAMTTSGKVDSIEFTPHCENHQCPAVLSDKFLDEQDAMSKQGITRKRRIGTMASRPKAMGMGSVGSSKKKDAIKTKNKTCNNDGIDEDEDDTNDNDNDSSSECESAKAAKSAKSRAERLLSRHTKNKKLGADGVGRFGDDDEEDEGNTDMSQQSQSQQSQQSISITPSRRQHRILRERGALLNQAVQLPPAQEVGQFNLSVIEEENDPCTETDDAAKKRKTRKAPSQAIQSDEENVNHTNTNKRQRQ